jgi:hypothetical protein
MIAQRNRYTLVAGIAAVLLVALIAGIAATLLGTSHHRSHRAALPAATQRPGLAAQQPAGFTAVPPLTDSPTETPVQQQYDAALASGLGSSASVEVAEQTQVPPPAFSGSWPPLAVADTPERWVSEFTTELLGIDFARQTRSGLAAWLSGEEAPELLPGIPPQIQDKVLYLSLFDTNALGGTSPIPDQATWDSYARSGVRWKASDLLAEEDPTYSQIVASGWEPVDQRFAAWDVSGVLTATSGSSSLQRHFSMVVYVGSAHWHPGYGTVLVNNWKET